MENQRLGAIPEDVQWSFAALKRRFFTQETFFECSMTAKEYLQELKERPWDSNDFETMGFELQWKEGISYVTIPLSHAFEAFPNEQNPTKAGMQYVKSLGVRNPSVFQLLS